MKILIIIFAFLSVSEVSFAQRDQDTPLIPEKNRHLKANEIGLVSGIGVNYQSGQLITPVCKCLFENASGFGYTVGIIYERTLSDPLRFGIAVHYYNNSMDARYWEDETIFWENPDMQAEIRSRHEAKMEFVNLGFMPFISLWPADFFFVRLGFSGNMLLSSNLRHDKLPEQNIVKTNTGELQDISDYATTVEDGEFPNVNSLVWGLNPQLGFNINIKGGLMISPVFYFFVPLSELSDQGDSFKANNFRFLLEFKWRWDWVE